MSEQAPERAAGGGGDSGGAGGLFKRKLGPFPMWAWLVIGAALIVGYVILKRQQASSTAATSTAATSTPASDIPQFVNQTYTTVTPPAAPTPSPSGTTTGTGTTSTKRPTQITASGTDSGDLNQIAGKYGITEQALIAANPGLRKVKVHPANSPHKLVNLIGSGLPVPAGTVLKIPPISAKS